MRVLIANAVLGGVAAAIVAWHVSAYGPFPFLRFSAAECVLIGFGVAILVLATASLARSERSRKRLEQTIKGLEIFENDMARRVNAMEQRSGTSDRDANGVFHPANTGDTRSASPTDTENQASKLETDRLSANQPLPNGKVLPSQQTFSDRELADLIRNGSIAVWFQPIVALPERMTCLLEAKPYLIPEIGEPVPPARWAKAAGDAGLSGTASLAVCAESLRFVRELRRSRTDISVVLPLHAAAIAETAEARQIESMLEANAAMAQNVVLEVDLEQFAEIGNRGRNRLDRCRNWGYELALAAGHRLDPARAALESGLFSYFMVETELLLSRDPDRKSGLLARLRNRTASGELQVIATGITREETAMELIDQDVLLAQGDIFSPARPLRDRSGSAHIDAESLATEN